MITQTKDTSAHYRSKVIKQLVAHFDDCGMTISVNVPEVGNFKLKGEALQEFLWTLRSNQSLARLDIWKKAIADRAERIRSEMELLDA